MLRTRHRYFHARLNTFVTLDNQSNKANLILSADGDRLLFPLVLGLASTEPNNFFSKFGWKVIPFKPKQPINLDEVNSCFLSHLIPGCPIWEC